MKILITFCLTLSSIFAFGQFAIVYDKESSCNVRSSAEKENNVVDTLENGHFVYCFETKNNWTNIDYSKERKELNGYVYKDRLILISSYPDIAILTKSKFQITFGKDSIKIKLTKQIFDKSMHKLTFNKEYKDQLELIDNKSFWGTDGGIPKTAYKSIEVIIGQNKILLPKNALDNLYEVSLYNTQANYDKINDILYIQAMNSDGAGGYEVIWKIEKGIYKERYIAYGF